MWIFTNKGFVSIVNPKAWHGDTGHLLVRARGPGEIESLFGDNVSITQTPERDYLYRALISADEVAKVIAEHIQNIAYPNFKDSIRDYTYLDTCHDVWECMYEYQRLKNKTKGY